MWRSHRNRCRRRTESWCVLASCPPVVAQARRPPGLRHLRVSTAVRWSDVSEPTKMDSNKRLPANQWLTRTKARTSRNRPRPRAGGVQYVEAGEGDAGQRLDNFLVRTLKGVPRTHVYRLLRKGEVRVNSKRAKPDQRLEAGDRIRLPPVRRPEPRRRRTRPATEPVAAEARHRRDRLRGRRPAGAQQAGRRGRARRQRHVARRHRGAAGGAAGREGTRPRPSPRPRDQRLPDRGQAPGGAARPARAAARRADREALPRARLRQVEPRPEAHRAARSRPASAAAASATSRCAATGRWR